MIGPDSFGNAPESTLCICLGLEHAYLCLFLMQQIEYHVNACFCHPQRKVRDNVRTQTGNHLVKTMEGSFVRSRRANQYQL